MIVGSTSNVLQDFHGTSSSGNDLMAGAGDPHGRHPARRWRTSRCSDAPGWVNVLAVIVLGVLAPLAGLRLKVVPALLIGAAGIGVLLVGSQILFEREGMINHVAYPFVAGVRGHARHRASCTG